MRKCVTCGVVKSKAVEFVEIQCRDCYDYGPVKYEVVVPFTVRSLINDVNRFCEVCGKGYRRKRLCGCVVGQPPTPKLKFHAPEPPKLCTECGNGHSNMNRFARKESYPIHISCLKEKEKRLKDEWLKNRLCKGCGLPSTADNELSNRGWHLECRKKASKERLRIRAEEQRGLEGKSIKPRLTKEEKLKRLLEPRTCTKCGELKPASGFNIEKTHISLRSWCKVCHSAANKANKEKKKTKYKKYHKNYWKTYLERKERGEIKDRNVFKELFKDKIENITDF